MQSEKNMDHSSTCNQLAINSRIFVKYYIIFLYDIFFEKFRWYVLISIKAAQNLSQVPL